MNEKEHDLFGEPVDERFKFNDKYEIIDKTGSIPPIKVSFSTSDGSESYHCDASTLLHFMNRQEILLDHKNKRIGAMVETLYDEIYHTDNLELQNILIGISKKELKLDNQADRLCDKLNKLNSENIELKEINQDHQDYISLLEEEKINLQIKLQKIRDYAMENGEVKQDVIEKVVFE